MTRTSRERNQGEQYHERSDCSYYGDTDDPQVEPGTHGGGDQETAQDHQEDAPHEGARTQAARGRLRGRGGDVGPGAPDRVLRQVTRGTRGRGAGGPGPRLRLEPGSGRLQVVGLPAPASAGSGAGPGVRAEGEADGVLALLCMVSFLSAWVRRWVWVSSCRQGSASLPAGWLPAGPRPGRRSRCLSETACSGPVTRRTRSGGAPWSSGR